MKNSIILPITLTAIYLLLCLGCGKQKFELKRQDYTANNFRIDGFYYNENVRYIYFFYKNGVIMHSGYMENQSISDIEKYFNSYENYKKMYEVPYYWGVFIVEGKTIKLERWISSDGGGYPNLRFNGTVVNDTTLLIDKPSGTNTYNFHQFSPKPDSTNKFIE